MAGPFGRIPANVMFWTLAIGGLAAIGILAAASRYETSLRLGGKVAELEADLERLEAEHGRLEAELEAVHSDPAYAEYIVRGELKLVRPGEKVYIPERLPEPSMRRGSTFRAEDYEPGPVLSALARDRRLRVPVLVGALMAIGVGVFIFGRSAIEGREACA
jgi:cell division protein FtsB